MKIIKIVIKINNLINNPCRNFLSYLYKSNGWKRAVFETSKDIFIKSEQNDGEIRILISKTGEITIWGYNFLDLITAFEFIASEFNSANMIHYLDHEKAEIKLDIEAEIDLSKWGEYSFTKRELNSERGNIIIEGHKAKLIFNNWDDGKELENLVASTFCGKIEMTENEIISRISPEHIVSGACLTWLGAKIMSYF